MRTTCNGKIFSFLIFRFQISVIGNGLIVISAPFMGRQVSLYHRLCISLAAADAWAASLLITGNFLEVNFKFKRMANRRA